MIIVVILIVAGSNIQKAYLGSRPSSRRSEALKPFKGVGLLDKQMNTLLYIFTAEKYV